MIAALCEGVLVVETAPRSGFLITARLANELGRDVFAIPGSIYAPLLRGCHALIRDGAKLVETPADVLVEFGIAAADRDAMVREAKAARPAARRSRHFGAHDCVGRAIWPVRGNARKQSTPTMHRRGTSTAAPITACPARALAADAAKQGASASLPPERCSTRSGHGPVPVDLLAARAGIAAGTLPHLLLRLELAGRVASLPGDRYQRLDAPAAAGARHAPRRRAVLHSGDEAQPASPPSSEEP